jgi:N utilization substance protein B
LFRCLKTQKNRHSTKIADQSNDIVSFFCNFAPSYALIAISNHILAYQSVVLTASITIVFNVLLHHHLMLNRRSLRIKVLQCLYAHEQNNTYRLIDLQKLLQRSVNNFHRLYHYQLFVIRQIAEYTTEDIRRRENKHLRTEADKNVSDKLLNNPIIEQLLKNEALNKIILNEKLAAHTNEETIKKLYQELTTTNSFTQYSSKQTLTLKDHTEIIRALLTEVMHKNLSYQEQLDDIFINYLDDKDLVNSLTLQAINSFADNDNTLPITTDSTDLIEKMQFGNDLMARTLENAQQFKDLIAPQLKNWELDRIALIDNILLRMALCELMFFPNIPLKVTINEYVDIAKLYSTPKSKEFINGILDKMMKKLVNEGHIKKLGRGMAGF